MSILWFGLAMLGKHVEKFHPLPQVSLLCCIVWCLWETNLRLEVVANMMEQSV